MERLLMIGPIRPKINPGRKKRRPRMIMGPKRSNLYISVAISSGRIPARTFDPSRGGIGRRLKTARLTFRITALVKIWIKVDSMVSFKTTRGERRIRKAKKTAMRMFVAGPARAVMAVSFLMSRKLKGSMGTGLAPPKRIGE